MTHEPAHPTEHQANCEEHEVRHARQQEVPSAPCPVCGLPMLAIRGSKHAICSNCGFKDSCCY